MKHHGEYELKSQRGLAPTDPVKKLLSAHLVRKYGELSGSNLPRAKRLFISCHYQGIQLSMIKQVAEQNGFEPITGEDLLDYDLLSEGLVDKMRSCTHFLGVWSREGALSVSNLCWPSPWLLWEFGVAQANALKWRLLIDDKIDPNVWKRVAPQRQHLTFSMDFESKLNDIINRLAKSNSKDDNGTT